MSGAVPLETMEAAARACDATQTQSKYTERNLGKGLSAIKQAIANLKDMCGDDDELLADMIEGEVDLETFAQKCAEAIVVDAAFANSLKEVIGNTQARKKRLELRAERIRTILAMALSEAETKTINLPAFTITKRDLKPSVIIKEEANIPSAYWKQPEPVLDKAKLRSDALERLALVNAANVIEDASLRKAELEKINKSNPPIPGIELDNGDITINIRTT